MLGLYNLDIAWTATKGGIARVIAVNTRATVAPSLLGNCFPAGSSYFLGTLSTSIYLVRIKGAPCCILASNFRLLAPLLDLLQDILIYLSTARGAGPFKGSNKEACCFPAGVSNPELY